MKIPSVISPRIKSHCAFETRHANTSACLCVAAGTHGRDARSVRIRRVSISDVDEPFLARSRRDGTGRHVNFSVMDRSKRRMRF